MKKLLIISVIGISLLLIEFILLIIFMQVGYILDYDISIFKISGALRYSLETNLMRLLFYFPLWCILIYVISNKINMKNIILKVALLNVFLYVIISLFCTLIFPFATEYFTALSFYYLIIITFTSPFILYVILPKSYWVIFRIPLHEQNKK